MRKVSLGAGATLSVLVAIAACGGSEPDSGPAGGAAGQASTGTSGAGGKVTGGQGGTGGKGNEAGAAGAAGGPVAGSAGSGGSAPFVPSEPSAGAEYGAGRRLKPKVYRSDDGLVEMRHYAFEDTKLGILCEFHDTTDGKLRCLPIATTTGSVFADASCTVQLSVQAKINSCYNPSSDVSLELANQCTGAYRVLQVSGEHLGTVFRRDGNGKCISDTRSPEVKYATLGQEVPLEQYVAAKEVVKDYGSGFGAVEVVAEDGAWYRKHLYDVTGDFACEPEVAADGVTRCLPVTAIYAGSALYTDAACKTEAFENTYEAANCIGKYETTRFAKRTKATFCPPRVTVQSLIRLTTAYEQNGAACAVSARAAFRSDKEAPPSAFAEGKPAKSPAGRLLPRTLLFGAGVAWTLGFQDTELGVDCLARTASDGRLRCVPQGPGVGRVRDDFAADSKCTESIIDASDACVPKLAEDYQSNFCPARWTVYSVGAVLTSIHDISPTCSAPYSVQPSDGYYAKGPELKPSSMVEMFLVSADK